MSVIDSYSTTCDLKDLGDGAKQLLGRFSVMASEETKLWPQVLRNSVDASVNSCINETVQKIEEHVRTGSSARQSMASETQVACRLDPTYDKDSQAFQFELKLTPMVSSMGPPPLPGSQAHSWANGVNIVAYVERQEGSKTKWKHSVALEEPGPPERA